MSDTDLIAFLVSPAAIIGLIVGLAEIAKLWFVDPRLIPVLDLILGLLFGIGVYGFMLDHGVPKGILIGVALGLSACGLFSGLKNISRLG